MKQPRLFSRELKLSVVKRMLAGCCVTALGRELKLRPTMMYKWRDLYRKGGAKALRPKRGRPGKGEPVIVGAAGKAALDLASARQRIGELERKIGQQELELDFFQRALRQVGKLRRRTGARGVKPSTSSSGR